MQDDQTFCPNCGTRVADPEGAPASDFYPPFTAQEAGSVGGQPYAQSVYPNAGQGFGPRCTTKKEFLMLPENKKLRSQIRGAAIICYICGGLTLLLMIISLNLMMLLDVAILVGLGLGVHLAYSRVCAILLAVYAVFSVIVGLVSTAPSAAGSSWWPPCLRYCVPSIWKRDGRSISNTDLSITHKQAGAFGLRPVFPV